MKIIHISDTHLGYQAYRTIDKNLSINQREADVGAAFSQAIDKILAIKPDVVLHSGDLFDTVRPSNRVLSSAAGELLRLSDADIPVVLISGNHSLPRMKDTGSIFQLFKLSTFSKLFPVFNNQYEVIRYNDLAVHAVPQCLTKEDFDHQLTQIKLDKESRYNVLMLHAAVAGIPEFSMGEFNEQEVPERYLKMDFDYIALGHYHRHTRVADRAFYSGSTERLSFNEVNQQKGFIEADLSTGKTIFHRLDVRPMTDFKNIDAKGKDASWVMEAIERVVAKTPVDGKIARITFDNISQGAQKALDFTRLREISSKALHLESRFNREDNLESPVSVTTTIGRLEREFQDYIKQLPADKEKQALLELGMEYLKKAEET